MKELSPELEARIQQAVENFMAGYGCCQSVVAAFADLYGVDRRTALRIGAGFGAGVGRLRMMCGAVSGMVTLAGLQCGATDGSDRAGKAHCYEVVRRLLEEFRLRNTSIICAEILANSKCTPVTDSHVPDERNARYYKTRPCARKVESAARIFAEYLAAEADDAENKTADTPTED